MGYIFMARSNLLYQKDRAIYCTLLIVFFLIYLLQKSNQKLLLLLHADRGKHLYIISSFLTQNLYKLAEPLSMSINEVSNNIVFINLVVLFVIISAVYMFKISRIFAYFITDLTYMSQALREKYNTDC